MTRRSMLAAPLLLLLASACKEELVCPGGQADCGGRCVSLQDDEANCGACGATVALPLQYCFQGASACAPGVTSCDGACTNLESDPAHCGACGTACAEGELCSTAGGGTCTTACDGAGWTACDRSCVQLASDRFHCGACGKACAPGESCVEGACRAAVFASCVNTNEVAARALDLSRAGAPWDVPSGPTALALDGAVLYSANGWPAASVSILPLDRSLGGTEVPLSGTDLQHVVVHEGLLLVSNAEMGTIVVLTRDGQVVDEIPMPDQQSGPNPHGVAFHGTSAYVALYGTQKVAKLDVSGLATCAGPDTPPACGAGGACDPGRECVAGTCRLSCGAVEGAIDLAAVPGTSDGDGLPTPSDVVAAAGLVFVGLSNLADDPGDPWPFWVVPSGPGKLAVVDPSAGDAVTLLDLGADCWKPGPMTLRGSTLWVGCGSLTFPSVAPGTLVPVDLSSGAPSVGAAIPVAPVVPSALAFCAGIGYVADQASGAVLAFDPDAGTTRSSVTVCPTGPYGYTAVADIACAD